MKSKDKLSLLALLEQKVKGVSTELELVAKRDKETLKVIAQKLVLTVEVLDELMIEGTPAAKGLDIHKATVERQIQRSAYPKVGLRTAIQYLSLVIADYKGFLEICVVKEHSTTDEV